ncbi:MAG: MIP family channel protein [Elusimicrobia bacterium]|nr:MIP family channel protein [Elusimicrobiota bacterium]
MTSPWKASLAELIGTFALIFVGAGAICANRYTYGGVGLVGIALAHGLVVAVMVSAIGHLSGGHINPAVTLGALVGGKITLGKSIAYWIAQLAGAALAALCLRGIFPMTVWQSVHLGTTALGNDVSIGVGIFLEAILTFFLVLTVFATAIDERGTFKAIAGFGIGLVVAFDILVGGPLTGASMNPARTFGPALVACFWKGHIVYWVGPFLGGAAAGWLYSRVFLSE